MDPDLRRGDDDKIINHPPPNNIRKIWQSTIKLSSYRRRPVSIAPRGHIYHYRVCGHPFASEGEFTPRQRYRTQHKKNCHSCVGRNRDLEITLAWCCTIFGKKANINITAFRDILYLARCHSHCMDHIPACAGMTIECSRCSLHFYDLDPGGKPRDDKGGILIFFMNVV